MSNRNEDLIQSLFEMRKQENRRVHNEYIHAMEIRYSRDKKMKKIVRTILSDFPEDSESVPNNQD